MTRVIGDEAQTTRSYARARSSSTGEGTIPWREGSPATRRVPSEVATAEAIDGPRFRYPSPDGPLLRELVAGYERVTGVAVSWPKKRNYIASCYRVHGTAFLTLVEQMFVAKGSDTNLLRELRQRQPAVVDTAEPATVIFGEQHPGLTYGPGGRPPFDPTSKRRYDRHPSNPDADGFFRDDELTVPTDRPSVKALTR